MRLSVVIPMYNEENRAKESLTRLLSFLAERLGGSDYEVIAVNDGSTDGTETCVRSLLCPDVPLSLISYTPNRGKGGALKEGMTAASGEFVLFTDCDLAYGTDVILEFLDCFEHGGGSVILGSRALHPQGYEHYTPFRRFTSRCYLALLRLYAGFSFSDSQCGVKGFEKSAAHDLFSALQTPGFAFDLEILLAAKDRGLEVCELPVRIVTHASSSVHPIKDAFVMLSDLRKIKKRRNAAKKAGKLPV